MNAPAPAESPRLFSACCLCSIQNALAEYSDEEAPFALRGGAGHTTIASDWYSSLSALLVKLHRQEEALKIVEFARTKQLASTFPEYFCGSPVSTIETADTECPGATAKGKNA